MERMQITRVVIRGWSCYNTIPVVEIHVGWVVGVVFTRTPQSAPIIIMTMTNMIRCLAQRPNLGIDCPDMLHWRTVHHVGACLRPMSKFTHRTDRSCVNGMIQLLSR
jgi:hypothetical protein